MNRAMSRPARPFATALLLSLLAAGFFVDASPALACSCATVDLGARLSDADGAFVGTYVDRSGIGDQRVAFTFEVERVVKGDFGPTAIGRARRVVRAGVLRRSADRAPAPDRGRRRLGVGPLFDDPAGRAAGRG